MKAKQKQSYEGSVLKLGVLVKQVIGTRRFLQRGLAVVLMQTSVVALASPDPVVIDGGKTKVSFQESGYVEFSDVDTGQILAKGIPTLPNFSQTQLIIQKGTSPIAGLNDDTVIYYSKLNGLIVLNKSGIKQTKWVQPDQVAFDYKRDTYRLKRLSSGAIVLLRNNYLAFFRENQDGTVHLIKYEYHYAEGPVDFAAIDGESVFIKTSDLYSANIHFFNERMKNNNIGMRNIFRYRFFPEHHVIFVFGSNGRGKYQLVAMDTLSGQQIGEYAVPPSSLSQLIGSRAFEKAESLERGIFLPYSSPNEPVKRGYLFSRDLSQVEDGFELELP